ncbi:MAG: tetratricopeptide repeat protein [SAR324 cluster bacterium]
MSLQESQLPGREAGLIQALREALTQQQEDPANHMPAYNAGLIYAQLGDLEAAVQSYRAALDRNPRFFQAYYNLALVYSSQERWEDAAQAYRQGLQQNGSDSEGWANLGAVYERLGSDEDALAGYAKALEVNPQEWQARVRIGRIHSRRGEWERALNVFETAASLNDQDWEAWNGLGLAQFHLNRIDAARDSYLKCVTLHDPCAEAYNNLGNLFAKIGDDAAAERAYRDAAQRSPKDPDIHFNLGEFLFNRRHPDCERVLRRVVELNPGDLDAWELLRRWYPAHPDYPAWRKALDILLARRPKDVELLRELAGVAERQNDMPAALEALRRVIELAPEDEDAHLFITRIHLKQDLVQEAYRHIAQVERVDNEVLALWKHIGQRLLHRGQSEEAETCYLKVVAHRELEVDLWQSLGEIAFARGDWEVAFERFAKGEPVTRNQWGLWKPLADRFLEEQQPSRATQCLDYCNDVWLYLPQQWPYAVGVWRAAGRTQVFLERLEAQLEQADAGARLWREMARLWEEEHAPERAHACLARALDRRSKLTPGIPELDAAPGAQPAPGATPQAPSGIVPALRHAPAAAPPLPPPAPAPAAPAPAAQLPALDTAETILNSARATLEAGDAQGTLAHLKRLGTAEQSQPGYWMLWGDASYVLGRMSEARTAFQKAVALDAKLFRGWFKLGNVLFRERRVADAEQAFSKASVLEPKEQKVWYNLGIAQAELKRLEAAQDSFRRALALERRFSQAWNWLGIVHVNRREMGPARRAFLRAIATERRSANAWFNLGMLYQALGRPAESQRCLAEADRLGGAVAGEGVVPVKLFHTRDPRQAGEKDGV